MVEAEQGYLKTHWAGFKQFWGERFGFLENYSRFIKDRDHPLPSWSKADVEEFIASDPVHGPILKNTREAVTISAKGTAVGALTLAGVAYQYSKVPNGVALGLLFGSVVGWTFGHEYANHSLKLYQMDTLAAQVKFMEWWQKKSEGRN